MESWMFNNKIKGTSEIVKTPAFLHLASVKGLFEDTLFRLKCIEYKYNKEF